MIDTKCEFIGAALEYTRTLGKPEREVLGWREMKEAQDDDVEVKWALGDLDPEEAGRLAKELYRAIHLTTTEEAKNVVKTVEDGDGIKAWGLLNAKYSQKTLSRMMRLQQECMYPKVAKVGDLVSAVLGWEAKWKRMEKEQAKDIKLPATWKMAAMLKLCPKEIADMVDLRWDEIGEEYGKLKDRVIGWATTKAEKKGGPTPMEIDGVDGKEREDEEEWWGDIDAVYPTTRCYFCQGFGHMARECPAKGKGKGKKGGGKGGEKGKGVFGGKGGYGKGGWDGGGWEKGGWVAKGGGKGVGWKGGEVKGGKGGKGGG